MKETFKGTNLYEDRVKKYMQSDLIRAESENLFITPFGLVKDYVVEFLTNTGILEEDRVPHYKFSLHGRSIFASLKKNTIDNLLTTNQGYRQSRNFMSDIDYILSAMNKKFIFVAKETKTLTQYNEFYDKIVLLPNYSGAVDYYQSWETENR